MNAKSDELINELISASIAFWVMVSERLPNKSGWYLAGSSYLGSRYTDKDSHSHICKEFNLREDVCNKYEFNPLTKRFVIDQINSKRDDSEAAEKWANRRDFKEVVEPLIIKPIVNPLELPKVSEPTNEQIGWLKEWASVWASVVASVVDSVWASVWNAVRAYVFSFFDVEYKFDFSSAIKLWESGLVPSFDGTIWRLHSGKNADIVFEWTPEVQE